MHLFKKSYLGTIDNAVLFFFLFSTAFAFTIKKLMNIGLFVASLYAVFWIIQNRPNWHNFQSNIKKLLVLLCLPILIVLGFELFRNPKHMAILDEYMRFLLAAPVLVWLYHRLEEKHWRFFQIAFALSFPALIFLDLKWIDLGQTAWTSDTRFATYFIEPNTAGLIGVIGTATLFSWSLNGQIKNHLRELFGACAIAAAYVLYDSETRIAWVAMCAVMGCVLVFNNSSKRIFITKLLVLCLILAGIWQMPSVQNRITQANEDLVAWQNGTNFNTSWGLRLNIHLGIIELANRQLLTGYGLEDMKSIQQAPYPKNPIADPDARWMWEHGGVHNHFLEKFVTHGILGLLVSLALFSLPALWVYRDHRSPLKPDNDTKTLVIWLCLGYFVCSMALILTLKFMNAFFAATLAIAFAQQFGVHRQQSLTET